MKNILLILIFITFTVFSQGQTRMFEEEEKKAIAFMESQLKEIYKGQFKMKFIGTADEFGKIYGFIFYIIENNDRPITFEYVLLYESPFKFDKQTFEEDYESIKVITKASEELEKDLSLYFSNARTLSDRIKNSDGTYRWVNKIYTAIPLSNDKEKTFHQLDSLSGLLSRKVKEYEVYFNFYFPKETDIKLYSENRFTFFKFENFRNKYLYQYRVDFKKNGNTFEINNRELYDNLNEEQSEKLKKSIEEWIKNNDFGNWELSLLTENSIERNLEEKKFMLVNQSGIKKFGFVNIKTQELKFVD